MFCMITVSCCKRVGNCMFDFRKIKNGGVDKLDRILIPERTPFHTAGTDRDQGVLYGLFSKWILFHGRNLHVLTRCQQQNQCRRHVNQTFHIVQPFCVKKPAAGKRIPCTAGKCKIKDMQSDPEWDLFLCILRSG